MTASLSRPNCGSDKETTMEFAVPALVTLLAVLAVAWMAMRGGK